jgi:hypothetical protein
MNSKPVSSVVLGGAPRSGKTTLAKKIASKQGLSHVSLDGLVHAFEHAFPELGISHDAQDYNRLCDALLPYVKAYLASLSRFGIPFILEGYYLRPKDFIADGYTMAFLGYPGAVPEELLRHLREREGGSEWTAIFPDHDLLLQLKGFIKASARIEKLCDEVGVAFVDVSTNWEQDIARAFDMLTA